MSVQTFFAYSTAWVTKCFLPPFIEGTGDLMSYFLNFLFLVHDFIIPEVISSIRLDFISFPAISFPCGVSVNETVFLSLISIMFFLLFRFSKASFCSGFNADFSIGRDSRNRSSNDFLASSAFDVASEIFPFERVMSAFFFRTPSETLNSLSESLDSFFASSNGVYLFDSRRVRSFLSGRWVFL